jgi:hypothetical protein
VDEETTEQPEELESEQEYETEEPEEAEESEPEEGEPEETEEEGEEVEYEGKNYKLPKELKEALLRQSDYTRKTQEVAEQRKAIESQRENAEIAIQAVTQFQKEFSELTLVNNQLEHFKGFDWNEAINESPADAMRLQMKYQQLVESRNELTGKINNIQQEVEQRRNAELQQAIQQGEAILAKELPGWGPEKKQAVARAAIEVYGFDPKELSTVTDPRMIKVLHDAAEFAKLKKESLSKIKTPEKTPAKPTVVVKASGSSKAAINPDKLSADDWVKWREADLKKKGRR